MPRRRLRTLTLWTGTPLCVLIAVAFVVSARRQAVFQVPTARGPAICLISGSVVHIADELQPATVSAQPHVNELIRWNVWRASQGLYLVEFPLYSVFAAVAIPTLLVWRFGRKPPKPGHFRCGYDLRGNVSGTCPECGVEVQA